MSKRLEEKITRGEYAKITQKLTEQCRTYCENLLSDANLSWRDIDTILMVGSMSNCPSVQDALKNWSGKDVVFNAVNPKTCVSEGAAIRAFLKTCQKSGKTAVVQSLEEKPNYENADKKIETAEISGKRTQTRILCATSVLPSSICLKLRSQKTGKFSAFKMLKKNDVYPTEFVRDFPIGRDGLSQVLLLILEGESDDPALCAELGNAVLPLDGEHFSHDRVRVTFCVDENGIIQVSALDLRTNRKVDAKIQRTNALSEEEIARAKNDAEEDEFVLA